MRKTRTKLIAVIGLSICLGAPVAHASHLEDRLIAWWRMELKVGSTIPDASGNGHDLTVNGSPTFEGNIVIFNDDGTLEAADSDALDLLGDWTVSYWVRQDSYDHSPFADTGNGWMNKHRDFHDAEGGWYINSSDSREVVNVSIYGSPNCDHTTQNGIGLGVWHRLTTTFDSGTHMLRIYFNSDLEYEADIGCGMIDNSYPVLIGGQVELDLNRRPISKGAMADIRIYDRTLSDSEVGELFAMGSPEDSDGDGVPNEDDECPDSDLATTIVIATCDSGVENEMIDDGCAMADLVAQCGEGVEDHGAYMRCVAHLTNFWKCAGLINGGAKGQIQSCAAQADIP